ncbi:MAG: Non-canonical purine NTP phosphatase [Microgenomates bacterium OLB23]|nr:MAG: Non-canonical purine NTP phosphatase [Microgenomates bacterium OLB23]
MKIAVGSKNPVKISAVKLAFEKVFPHESWVVEGIEVPSGVSDQPMSDIESIKGARARAMQSRDALHADYGVGIEGGLQQIDSEWFDCGWIVILDKNGIEGIGSSVRMHTPNKMIAMVKEGMELGHVNDVLFGIENSKHGDGHFGLMTHNAITRTSGYTEGVIAALARFIRPEVY